jgi:hypothetical protein
LAFFSLKHHFFLIGIEWKEGPEFFFEGFVTPLSCMSQLFFLERKIGGEGG